VKFTIAKTGSGEAILAQIEARISDQCNDALPAIEPGPPGLGAACDAQNACAEGSCDNSPFGEGTQCDACDVSHVCPAGVCGAVDAYGPFVEPHSGCVTEHSKALGEVCLVDLECETGMCNSGTCAACESGNGCPGTEVCAPGWSAPPGSGLGPLLHNPYVCAPNQGLREAGETCVNHADCASGTCDGVAHSMCPDGRACVSDDDCPFIDTDHEACTPVGIVGGVCE
jgi:hypothetical protein